MGSITKADLTELTVMNNPPQKVKDILTCLCTLLNNKKAEDWKEVRTTIRNPDIVHHLHKFANFDRDNMNKESLAALAGFVDRLDTDLSDDAVKRNSAALFGVSRYLQAIA